MSNQEMQFADPDWKPSQQLDTQNNPQEQEIYPPQPINSDYREQNKWMTAPPSPPQQGYAGIPPYADSAPQQMQGGNFRQRPYRRRGRGPWFWIILAFIMIAMISRGLNPFHNPGPDHPPFDPKQMMYTVTEQPNIVINDTSGSVTVTVGQSNNEVIIQPGNGDNFSGNPNDIQTNYNKDSNTVNASVPGYTQDSVDLQVTVPKGSNLQLQTASGNITVTGVDGQMTLVTQDGGINASNDGLSGLSTMTATNSGDINFDGTISAGGNYQFNTTSGKVSVALPTSPAFHFDASTNSGSINIPGVQKTSSGTHATGNVGTNSQVQGTNVILKSDSGAINMIQK